MTPHERALIAEYEAVLAREGLGVLDDREVLHPAYVGGGTNWVHKTNLTGVSGRDAKRSFLANVAAKAQFWSLVTKGVAELPRNYPHRGFLTRLAESGNLLAACREYRLTHNKGRWEFGVFLRSVGLGSSRPARYVTRSG